MGDTGTVDTHSCMQGVLSDAVCLGRCYNNDELAMFQEQCFHASNALYYSAITANSGQQIMLLVHLPHRNWSSSQIRYNVVVFVSCEIRCWWSVKSVKNVCDHWQRIKGA